MLLFIKAVLVIIFSLFYTFSYFLFLTRWHTFFVNLNSSTRTDVDAGNILMFIVVFQYFSSSLEYCNNVYILVKISVIITIETNKNDFCPFFLLTLLEFNLINNFLVLLPCPFRSRTSWGSRGTSRRPAPGLWPLPHTAPPSPTSPSGFDSSSCNRQGPRQTHTSHFRSRSRALEAYYRCG